MGVEPVKLDSHQVALCANTTMKSSVIINFNVIGHQLPAKCSLFVHVLRRFS